MKKVLSTAGADCRGGAGIQADIDRVLDIHYVQIKVI